MLKSTIHTRSDPMSPSSSVKLGSISPRKSSSRIAKIKPIGTPKTNLKKLELTEHFLPMSPHHDPHEGSFSHSLKGIHPIQSVHLSPRELSLTKIMRTEPNRSRTLEKIDKNMALTIKDFGQVTRSPKSGHELGQLSLRSPQRLMSLSSKRELDSSSLDESKILSSNFSKFNNYLMSLKKSESRKSPLAKETFYYPDQLEANKRFARLGREMKLLDEKGLFHFRTIREGKKERIKLPIGTKTYMKIKCEGKKFPLHVKVETKLGTFQIFVSKNNERPDRLHCDHYFSQAYFEIIYPDPEKIRYLYFHVLGTGNMELHVTMNFSDREDSRPSNLLTTQLFGHKGISSMSKYEIFHENMTRDEERDFKELVDEIKKERAQKAIGQNRDIITDNLSLAVEFPKIKKEQQAEQKQKRDFALFKNREKRAHLIQRKKIQMTCDMLKPDVKHLAKTWRLQKEAEIHQNLTFQKSWLVLATLCSLGAAIRHKKRDVIAWRVITRIREHAVLRIQRMVRNYLSRPLEIKGKDPEDENATNQHQELTMLSIFNALNSVVLQSKLIQKQKAEKMLVSCFQELAFAANISRAAKKYSAKVAKIQKKWKQKLEVINTRVDIFLTCWNEYCQLLLSETKAKSKLLAAFSSIKEQHIREKGKSFVKGRMGTLGTMKSMQYIIDAFKGSNAPPSIVSLANERRGSLITLQKGALRRGSKLAARGSLLHLRESLSDLQSQSKSKFLPSLAELRDIFDSIVNEIQHEETQKQSKLAIM